MRVMPECTNPRPFGWNHLMSPTSQNEYGQPVGPSLGEWAAPPLPTHEQMQGRTVLLDPLSSSAHAEALTSAFNTSSDELWTYLPWGPFSSCSDPVDQVGSMIETIVGLDRWLSYAVLVEGSPLGMVSYLRIDPPGGCIEIGGICFSSGLQRSTAATEALYLLIERSFAMGYRRCEWKCDALNAPSRRAAERLGFTYEGTFRKASHYKGRSRDTAWFAIVDDDWPALNERFTAWLAPDNFDQDGAQISPLSRVR